MIAVVDYGLGNLASVRNAFRAVGADVVVTADKRVIGAAEALVLPGVGAAALGMELLQERGLDAMLLDRVRHGVPLLGLCLGMQLFFDTSEEGDTSCLSLLPGSVRRLRTEEKVPQIGWNQVAIRSGDAAWRHLPADPYFYFVHSYVCVPENGSVVAGTTEYGETFCSAVVSGSIWGMQFHPERSGRLGLLLIQNFVEHCGESGIAAR